MGFDLEKSHTMGSEPLLSIVVTGFNNITTISAAINSVPLLEKVELICIDDSSTDGTATLLGKLLEERPGLLIAKQKNEGISAARNSGLRNARGRYVSFLDGDDVLIGESVTLLLDSLEQDTVDCLIADHITCRFSSVVSASENYGQTPGLLSDQERFELIRAYLSEPIGNSIIPHAWGKIYRRMFLDTHSLAFDESVSIYEDTLFVANLLTSGARCRYINLALYKHYVRENSLSSTFEKNPLGFYKPMKILSDYIDNEVMLNRAIGVYVSKTFALSLALPFQRRYLLFRALVPTLKLAIGEGATSIRNRHVLLLSKFRLLSFPLAAVIIYSISVCIGNIILKLRSLRDCKNYSIGETK